MSRVQTLLALFLLCFNFFVYPQQDPEFTGDSTHTLINSVPEGARVFFNDIPVGITPLTLYNIPAGGYSVKFQKEGYKDWNHGVYIYENIINDITAVLDGTYGIVDVYSDPSGAKVYIDDAFMGTTPVKNLMLDCSRYKIKIQKEGYEDFFIVYPITPRYFYLFQKLASLTSTLTVEPVLQSINITVDGKPLNKDSLENMTITKGIHEIEFSGSPLKRKFSREVSMSPDYTYRIELKSKSTDPVLYSAVIPGSGQIYNGSYIKGTAVMAGAVVSGILALSSISNYNDKVEAANYATRSYIKSATESQASFYHKLVNSTRADANKALTYKRIAIGAFIGIYFYNLIDALLFESNDYVKVYSKMNSNTTDLGMQMPRTDYRIDFSLPLK